MMAYGYVILLIYKKYSFYSERANKGSEKSGREQFEDKAGGV